MLDRTTPSFSFFAVLLAAACSGRSEDAPTSTGGGVGGGDPNVPVTELDGGSDAAVCAFGQIICDGNEAKTCDGKGGFLADQSKKCGTKCSDGLGCVQCMPNTGTCAGKVAKVCDPTGTQEVNIACDGLGMVCQADGCKGACSPTILGLSYRGCDFWPTVTSNSVWSDRLHQGDGGFHFGVLLGNDTKATANVKITREGSAPIDLAIAPGKVVKQALDWVTELKGPDWEMPFLPTGPTQSVKKAGGAYHIVSDSPIIAYQFNALEGRAGNANGCPLLPGGFGGCFSYSNDASLLIPAHALSSNYVVSGYHAWHSEHFPQNGTGKLNMGDFIAITATGDTMVTIALRPNQTVLPSLGLDPLPRFSLGGKMSFPMTSGMVVQLFTPGLSENETFGGTEVTASAANGSTSAPIQIISGMGCASIPEDVSPCGHVEDLVLPTEVLGKDYVVPAMVASTSANIAQTIRIQSISDGTALTFEPTKFNAVTLNRGEVLELPSVAADVRITSTTPFAVTQYMNGRGDVSKASASLDGKNLGGPNQVSVPPTSQFRTDYSFIASPLYDTNFVSIVAPTGTAVTVDSQVISPERFTAVGATGMSVTRYQLNNNDQVHSLHADKPVGIFVFGYNPFSSYMYSGGFDLKRSSAAVVR